MVPLVGNMHMVASLLLCCGAQVRGGLASQPAMMEGGSQRSPPTWPPTKAGRLAGQAVMYEGCIRNVGSPLCMGSPPCITYPGIQVLHHEFHGIHEID